MRVISGTAGGISLKAVPGTGTRPTTDKVKEAIFSRIGPYFQGGNVLDLFAGTGGLGIEALSRGMDKGIFIDKERKSIEVVLQNLTAAGLLEQAEVYRNDSTRALNALAKRSLKFDLVFIDPPYKMKNVEELMLSMEQYSLLEQQAVIIVEHDANHTYANQVGALQMDKRAVYGDIAVTIYSNTNHVQNGEEYR